MNEVDNVMRETKSALAKIADDVKQYDTREDVAELKTRMLELEQKGVRSFVGSANAESPGAVFIKSAEYEAAMRLADPSQATLSASVTTGGVHLLHCTKAGRSDAWAQ